MSSAEWYAVRCFFRWEQWEGAPYEERVTLWLAESDDEALELAQAEAAAYARDNSMLHLGPAQSYAIGEGGPLEPGAEVFSLLRDSELAPDEYLRRFFDTGREHLSHDPDDYPAGDGAEPG